MLKSKKIFALAVAATLLAPVFASAAQLTNDQVSSVIGLLQSFNVDAQTVATVQGVLTNTAPTGGHGGMMLPPPPSMMGSTTGMTQPPPMMVGSTTNPHFDCSPPGRNLVQGSRGDDVKELQRVLGADPRVGFTGTTTGTYGPMTARAVMRFQQLNGVASTTTGTVGPATRQALSHICTRPPITWNGQQQSSGDQNQGRMPPPGMMGSSTAPKMGGVMRSPEPLTPPQFPARPDSGAQ